MGRKKRNAGKKTKNRDTNVINLEDKKEKRRQELRAAAEISRKKRGVKSIKDQMMEEVAAEEINTDPTANMDFTESGETPLDINNVSANDKSESKENISKKKFKKKSSAVKKNKKAHIRIFLVVALVAVIIAGMSLGNIISLKIEEKEARDRLEQLKIEKEKLEADTKEIGTDVGIERQARNWLKMAKRGETLYIIGDEKGRSISAAKLKDNTDNTDSKDSVEK